MCTSPGAVSEGVSFAPEGCAAKTGKGAAARRCSSLAISRRNHPASFAFVFCIRRSCASFCSSLNRSTCGSFGSTPRSVRRLRRVGGRFAGTSTSGRMAGPQDTAASSSGCSASGCRRGGFQSAQARRLRSAISCQGSKLRGLNGSHVAGSGSYQAPPGTEEQRVGTDPAGEEHGVCVLPGEGSGSASSGAHTLTLVLSAT